MTTIIQRALVAASFLAFVSVEAQAKAKSAKQDAEVQCQDGTTSKAGRGACSHHGGVAKAASAEKPAATPKAAPDRKSANAQETSQEPQSRATPQGRAAPTVPQRAPPAGQPTARCKDGALSYSRHRSGTCSGHGGVAEWLGQ